MTSNKKTIVLTGATRGLGRAMVAKFIEQGHTVLGCGRSENAVADLQAEFGESGRFSAIDVSNDAQVAQWAGEMIDEYEPPDLLLNNAALINENAALWDVPVDEFSVVIGQRVRHERLDDREIVVYRMHLPDDIVAGSHSAQHLVQRGYSRARFHSVTLLIGVSRSIVDPSTTFRGAGVPIRGIVARRPFPAAGRWSVNSPSHRFR